MVIAEQELITLLKARNESAFSYLYDTYSGPIYGFILTIVSNRSKACEVLEKTFTQAWFTIETYDASRARLFTWIQNIARTLSFDIVDSKKEML